LAAEGELGSGARLRDSAVVELGGLRNVDVEFVFRFIFFPCLLDSISRHLWPVFSHVEHGRPLATASHLIRLLWQISQATADRWRGFPLLVDAEET